MVRAAARGVLGAGHLGRAEGVRLAAGPLFAPEGGLERFVRLPYTRSPEQLAEATERLARAWQETQTVRRTTRRRRRRSST